MKKTEIWLCMALVSVLVAGVFSLAGCSKKKEAADDGKFRIGVCGRDFKSPFQTSIYETMEKTAKNYPNLELEIRDGQQDSTVQTNIIQTFIQQKKDLIIVVANQVDALVPAVNQCKEAGIPVINVNVYVGKGADLLTFIGCDSYEGGWKQGELTHQMLGETGKILLVQALLGTDYQIQRTAGLEDYLKQKVPGIQIVDKQTNENDNAKTVTVVQNALTRFPKGQIDGIVVQGPLDAIAAADTCIDAGRTELVGKIIAMDYSTQVEEAIKEGKLFGTVNQDPVKYGVMGIEHAMKYLNGEMKASDFDKQIYIELPAVNKDNVNSMKATWS
jgi:ribose transport system substrate-binding protein